ncbi:MAG: PAS domain-containing protein [Myxococcaceae bacterium]|nr:PAS domain-containing protein [Myxococcaceae bacterium]
MESTIAQPDVTLQLDLRGVITAARLGGSEAGAELGWVGSRWADTVSERSRPSVTQMLDEAIARGVSAFISLEQRFAQGTERRVEYTTVRLGAGGGLLAIGRSNGLVAEIRSRLVSDQRSMERESWKQQHPATRYRLLFETSSQPELTLTPDFKVAEANPAAAVLGLAVGSPLVDHVSPADREAFTALLQQVKVNGTAPGVSVHFAPAAGTWLARVSSVPGDPEAGLAVHLSSAGRSVAAASSGVPWEELIARLPVPVVVVGSQGEVRRANPAFAELIEVPDAQAVSGQGLDRWLTVAGPAGPLLPQRLAARAPSVTALALRESSRAQVPVELSVSLANDGAQVYAALLVRRLRPQSDSQLPRSAELDELVARQVASVEQASAEASAELAARRWGTRSDRSPGKKGEE